MSSSDPSKRALEDPSVQPIERFNARRLTRKENVVKEEIDAYHVSDVDNTSVIYVGDRALSIYQSLDLPDTDCDGLIFKQRLIQTAAGECLLLARWKPDRHLRRTAPEWSQKWFVEKELFPPDLTRFFTRMEKRVTAAESSDDDEDAAGTDKE